jgi:hypothetical protein
MGDGRWEMGDWETGGLGDWVFSIPKAQSPKPKVFSQRLIAKISIDKYTDRDFGR